MSAMDQEVGAQPIGEDPHAPDGPGRGRMALKWAIIVVLILLWVRVVLFAWLFPLIERHVDNPEFDEETSQPVESSRPAG